MPRILLNLFVHLQTTALLLPVPAMSNVVRHRAPDDGQPDRELGQATTEYALVLLAAALVGLLVVAWATAGGGAERVGRLFNRVIDSAIERV
jgi:hypothetical protein